MKSTSAKHHEQYIEQTVLLKCLKLHGVSVQLTPAVDGYSINMHREADATSSSWSVRKEDTPRCLWRLLRETIRKQHVR